MEPINDIPDSAITQLREFEGVEETRSVLRIIGHWMAIPLFLFFWSADLILYPDLKWPFLAIRLSVIPISLLTTFLIDRAKNLQQAQWAGLFLGAATATCLNLIVFMIPDPTTPYYAGLNLVAIGGLSFIPFDRRFFAALATAIFAPYFAIVLLKSHESGQYQLIYINSCFMMGSLIVCFLIRYFNEALRMREIYSRLALQREISSRDVTIRDKTAEAVRLNTLSTQFSPQVVRAIREGRVDVDKGVHRAQICAIFVDIVGSTERVVRLDQQKVDRVLARFMDTVVSTFLKYDLTIDKFQGDGMLAFANDPISHPDFIQRTCYAALEVRERLREDREFYLLNWKKEMEVRVGISAGFANVGFYGNKKFFRSYTAIGAPLPMAARLTSMAEPEQILIDSDIASILQNENFVLKKLGERVIKGFEEDKNVIFELVQAPEEKLSAFNGTLNCPHHPETVLYLEKNDRGHFIMRCRQCDFTLDEYSLQILGEIPKSKPKAA